MMSLQYPNPRPGSDIRRSLYEVKVTNAKNHATDQLTALNKTRDPKETGAIPKQSQFTSTRGGGRGRGSRGSRSSQGSRNSTGKTPQAGTPQKPPKASKEATQKVPQQKNVEFVPPVSSEEDQAFAAQNVKEVPSKA